MAIKYSTTVIVDVDVSTTVLFWAAFAKALYAQVEPFPRMVSTINLAQDAFEKRSPAPLVKIELKSQTYTGLFCKELKPKQDK